MAGTFDKLSRLWYNPMQAEMALLYAEIRTIENLKQMAETAGWRELRDNFVDRIINLDNEITRLAENPADNDKSLRWKAAVRTVIMDLLQTVETTLSVEREKRKKIHQLETIREAGPSEDYLSPADLYQRKV